MNHYYLMAQLPSLDGIADTAPMPITEERLYELCGRFLGKKELKALIDITLLPPKKSEKSGYSLIDSWNDEERKLRFALGIVRAEKSKKTFEYKIDYLPQEIMQTARTAVEINDPMEAEKYLNKVRMDFLETLRPMDAFCIDALFYYAIKLKLILRMRQFDGGRGLQNYGKIYDSIINGDRREVTQ